MKKHLGFIIFFSVISVFFLRGLISLRAGFVEGDYAVQFYPWSLIYCEAIKSMQFPYWTRFVQCGFPLMAEGQIGGFYPLNMLFYFLLPFTVAYNYIVILHFFMAGFFTYLYARKIGTCQWGGAVAALIFCFGSAYAGCAINIATVKTLTWFPLILYFFERYFYGKSKRLAALIGVLVGMQLLAGAVQVAVYSVVFCGIYFFYGLAIRKDLTIRDAVAMMIILGIAGVVFLPQYLISSELAGYSNRAEASLGFALWGSFPPLNFMSAVFPYWISRGARFYVSIFGMLFLIKAFLEAKLTKRTYPLFLMVFLSFFLALGKYNPVYVLGVKFLGLYSFRNPSKFILFGVFAVSVLAGIGFTGMFKEGWNKQKKTAIKFFTILIVLITGLFSVAKLALTVFKKELLRVGEWYVTNYVHGKYFHRKSLPEYIDGVKGVYDGLVNNAALTEPFILTSVILCAIAVITGVYLLKKRQLRPEFKGVFIALIFFDLAIFSLYGTGFRGNIKDFGNLDPRCRTIFNIVSEDKDTFRILPYGLFSAKMPNWAIPSTNAVYGIDNAAIYTPLANEYYRKELEVLEIVDNALGVRAPEESSLDETVDLIKILNVKYIVSVEYLEKDFLRFLASEDGVYLYEVEGYFPRAFVSKKPVPGSEDRSVKVKVVSYTAGHARFRVVMPYDGFLVFSENRYPGWKVYVDGEESATVPFSVIQAVKVGRGEHKIEFQYSHF